MTVCHVSVVESLSDSWLRFLTVVRGRKPEDDMRRATMMLTNSIQATSSIEHELGAELAELSCRARTLRNKHVKADLVTLLTSSKTSACGCSRRSASASRSSSTSRPCRARCSTSRS